MKRKNNFGTSEWSVKTVNCCTGCSHDCRYCYAKRNGHPIQTSHSQASGRLSEYDQRMSIELHKKYDGQVMFPSSHDITPNNLDACLTVMSCWLLATGCWWSAKPALGMHKGDLWDVQARIGEDEFCCGFTIAPAMTRSCRIGSRMHPMVMKSEKQCLDYASQRHDFRTSVSVEPMLDSANIDILISELSTYVTHSIWIGTMNHLGRFEKAQTWIWNRRPIGSGKGRWTR